MTDAARAIPIPTTRAMESRADVDSIELLHEQRRQLLPEYGLLRAMHGPFGCWDAKRKAMLSAVAVRVRMDLQAAQEKTTEAYIDAAAHADDQYQRFLDESISQKIRYVELEAALSEIQERIKSREIELHVYAKEISLR